MKSIINRSEMAVVHSAQFFKGIFFCRVEISDLLHGFGSEFLRMAPCSTSFFRKFIIGVIFVGSKKKMIGFYTRRVIAVVKNIHPIRNWPFMNDPRLTVCGNHFLCSWNMKRSVIPFISSTSPDPASISFTDELKENFFDGDWSPFPFEMAWSTAGIMILNKIQAIKTFFIEIPYSFIHLGIVAYKGECHG